MCFFEFTQCLYLSNNELRSLFGFVSRDFSEFRFQEGCGFLWWVHGACFFCTDGCIASFPLSLVHMLFCVVFACHLAFNVLTNLDFRDVHCVVFTHLDCVGRSQCLVLQSPLLPRIVCVHLSSTFVVARVYCQSFFGCSMSTSFRVGLGRHLQTNVVVICVGCLEVSFFQSAH